MFEQQEFAAPGALQQDLVATDFVEQQEDFFEAVLTEQTSGEFGVADAWPRSPFPQHEQPAQVACQAGKATD